MGFTKEKDQKIAELQKLKENLQSDSEKRGRLGPSTLGHSSNGNDKTYSPSDLDRMPKLITGSSPDYPEALLSSGLEGTVRLLIEIDRTGKVEVRKVR